MMQLELHHPLDGYYRGTRFDWSGVFKSLVFKGKEWCGEWFTAYSPTLHDCVCGPAEEFSVAQLGELWLKPGVGLLIPDGRPYDRFKLYEVADPGRWEADGMSFRHILEGCYDYRKEIAVTGENRFEIRHRYQAILPYEGDAYNHNFITFDNLSVGPSRRMDFPFMPTGTWRARYDSVGFAEKGIRFYRQLEEGESVYCGDIHEAGKYGMPYAMTLGDGPHQVQIRGDAPVSRTVFWANHRIACLEPYVKIRLAAGQTFCWNIEYTLI